MKALTKMTTKRSLRAETTAKKHEFDFDADSDDVDSKNEVLF
jgi:hypothetical protein